MFSCHNDPALNRLVGKKVRVMVYGKYYTGELLKERNKYREGDRTQIKYYAVRTEEGKKIAFNKGNVGWIMEAK